MKTTVKAIVQQTNIKAKALLAATALASLAIMVPQAQAESRSYQVMIQQDGHQTVAQRGVIVRHKANGRIVKIFPNGKRVTLHPNGTKITVFPNGRKVTVKPNGTKIIVRANGTRIVQKPAPQKPPRVTRVVERPVIVKPPKPIVVQPPKVVKPPKPVIVRPPVVVPPKPEPVCHQEFIQMKNSIKQAMKGSGARFTEKAGRLMISLPNDVTFDLDSFFVKYGLRPALRNLALDLQGRPRVRIKVTGHTDSWGSHAYNQTLSENRAYAVAQILNNNGLSYSRMQIQGFGETQPIATNHTHAGRAENRRVEITLIRKPRPRPAGRPVTVCK